MSRVRIWENGEWQTSSFLEDMKPRMPREGSPRQIHTNECMYIYSVRLFIRVCVCVFIWVVCVGVLGLFCKSREELGFIFITNRKKREGVGSFLVKHTKKKRRKKERSGRIIGVKGRGGRGGGSFFFFLFLGKVRI